MCVESVRIVSQPGDERRIRLHIIKSSFIPRLRTTTLVSDNTSRGGQPTGEETSWVTLEEMAREEHAEHIHLRRTQDEKEDDTPKREMMNLLGWAIQG